MLGNCGSRNTVHTICLRSSDHPVDHHLRWGDFGALDRGGLVQRTEIENKKYSSGLQDIKVNIHPSFQIFGPVSQGQMLMG